MLDFIYGKSAIRNKIILIWSLALQKKSIYNFETSFKGSWPSDLGTNFEHVSV